jgi:hypothetical protein
MAPGGSAWMTAGPGDTLGQNEVSSDP